jgi:hypothetical protein
VPSVFVGFRFICWLYHLLEILFTMMLFVCNYSIAVLYVVQIVVHSISVICVELVNSSVLCYLCEKLFLSEILQLNAIFVVCCSTRMLCYLQDQYFVGSQNTISE